MPLLELFFTLSLVTQLVHSLEEILTGFHKKWYLFSMPLWIFVSWEVLFSTFWIVVLLINTFPSRPQLQAFFLILMFANGVQHIFWAGWSKKYVPGVVTAVLHLVVSLTYYFQEIF